MREGEPQGERAQHEPRNVCTCKARNEGWVNKGWEGGTEKRVHLRCADTHVCTWVNKGWEGGSAYNVAGSVKK